MVLDMPLSFYIQFKEQDLLHIAVNIKDSKMRNHKIPLTEAVGLMIIKASSEQLFRTTLVIDSKTSIKVTKIHKYDGRAKSETFKVTLGALNYRERQAVKGMKKKNLTYPFALLDK